MYISKERREGIEYHAEVDDYFETLATVLTLIKRDEGSDEIIQCLDWLIGDLLYLQERYRIVKKWIGWESTKIARK